MSDFLNPLEVRMLPESDKQSWILTSPLVYKSDLLGDELITVPKGFATDFVSMEILKGVGVRPAVLHDYCYASRIVSRAMADEIFHEALDAVGVDKPLADVMFIAVRMFGQFHYGREDVCT